MNKTDTAPIPMSLEGDTEQGAACSEKGEAMGALSVWDKGTAPFEELKDPVSPSNESLNPDWKVSRSGPSRKGRTKNAPSRRMCQCPESAPRVCESLRTDGVPEDWGVRYGWEGREEPGCEGLCVQLRSWDYCPDSQGKPSQSLKQRAALLLGEEGIALNSTRGPSVTGDGCCEA